MDRDRETLERARALALLDNAIGILLGLTVDDVARAKTLKIVSTSLREIQQERMSNVEV